jgi:hypothetical protein
VRCIVTEAHRKTSDLLRELDDALDWGAESDPLLADHLPSTVFPADETNGA